MAARAWTRQVHRVQWSSITRRRAQPRRGRKAGRHRTPQRSGRQGQSPRAHHRARIIPSGGCATVRGEDRARARRFTQARTPQGVFPPA